MMDLFFFAKTFALTLLIVLVMQIHVGDRSIETHAMSWVQSSAVVAPLHAVSRGAAKVVHDISHQVADAIHGNVNKNKKEDARLKRESPFRFSHSSKSNDSDED